jgi:capsular exopolysaccharide synthesis family protein
MSSYQKRNQGSEQSEIDDFDEEPDAPRRNRGSGRRILQSIIGRWYWIVLGVILGLGGGFYYLSKATVIHSATATLLVKQRATTTLLTENQSSEELDMRSLEALNTVVGKLKSRTLLAKVAAREELTRQPGLMPVKVEWAPQWFLDWQAGEALPQAAAATPVPPPHALAGAIDSWTSIVVRRGTRLLDLTVRHPDPEVARILADLIVEQYVQDSTATRSDDRQGAIAMLQVEADRARSDFQAAQKALGSYQEALKLQAGLVQRDEEIAALAQRYLPAHPKMISARETYDRLRDNLLAELERLRGSGADGEFWKTVAEEWEEAEAMGDEPRLAAARRILLSRTAVLESEIRSQESVFNVILTKLQETDVNQAASKDNQESECEISDAARISPVPVAPVPSKAMTMALAGGGMAGLALALLLGFLDNKFRSVSQLEALTGLPVLAAVSTIDDAVAAREVAKRKRKQQRKGKDHSTASKAPEHEARWDRHLVFRHGMASSQYAEMYRVLRASVSLLGDESQRKITLFTSAIPGEGKTLTSVNFALAAAAQGKSVLLIDLDLRKPATHRALGLKQDVHAFGATQLLAGRCTLEEAVYRGAGIKGLDLILSGTRAPNPGELLQAKVLSALLDEARARYDVVVLDTAPVLAVPDTRMIAPLADNRCLVVRAERTPVGAVVAALELLESGGSPPAGLVFNGYSVRRRLPGYRYYSYYGNGPYSRYAGDYRYQYGNYGKDVYGEEEER